MSAYVLDAEFFESLASVLATHAENPQNVCDLKYDVACAVREYLGYGSSCFDSPADAYSKALSKVGALYTANVDAVCQRYADDDLSNYMPADSYIRAKRLYDVFWPVEQLVKHLQCLKYQMSEGTVPSEPLYLALEKLINRLCVAYVQHSPAYNTAKWGM